MHANTAVIERDPDTGATCQGSRVPTVSGTGSTRSTPTSARWSPCSSMTV